MEDLDSIQSTTVTDCVAAGEEAAYDGDTNPALDTWNGDGPDTDLHAVALTMATVCVHIHLICTIPFNFGDFDLHSVTVCVA